jgi:putative ABC transport system permease protein
MARLILFSLLRRRWQSLAAAFGVALGAALLMAVFLLYWGFQRGLERGRQKLGADLLVVPANATVNTDEALFSGAPLSVYMDRKYADQARRIAGIRRVDAQFFTQTLRLECCSVGTETRLIGVESEALARLLASSSSGLTPLATNEVVVGSALFGGVNRPGALIELLGEIFKLGGRLEPTGTALDHSILMRIDSARDLAAHAAGLEPVWSQAGDPHGLISALLIEVEEPARLKEISRALEAVGPLRVVPAAETFQRLKRLMNTYALLLAAAAGLTALGGVAGLAGHFSASVWERKGEWALYRALGASKPRVVQLVVGEAAALAVGGAMAGLPLGYGLYRLAFRYLSEQNSFPFVASRVSVLVAAAMAALFFFAVMGCLCAAVPAVRAAQLDPARAMAQGEIG